ncbi:ABC transporter ATP-binding protein [Kosakonia cowanii]|nr:ABC transporter ATP-binding protein [Kosakonia cowanii]
MFFSVKKLPLILQNEISECGLACLAMIAGYFGKRVDMASSRLLHATSHHGMSLRELSSAFDKIGITSRAARLELDELANLTRPVVLHWAFNHFVVLSKITKRGAIIHDPAIGRREITRLELSNNFTGIILEAWPTETFDKKPAEMNISVLDMFSGIQGLKKVLGSVLFLSVLVELLSLSVPAATQFTIDVLLRASDQAGIVFVALVVVVALLLKSAFSVVRALILINLRYTLNVKWAERFLNRLVRLTVSFFDKRHTGDITSRFQSLVGIQEAFTADMIASVLDGLVILLSMIIIFTLSPVMASGVVVIMAAYVALRCGLLTRYRNLVIEKITCEAFQSTHFLETVRTIRAIKMLNLVAARRKGWVDHVVKSARASAELFKLDLLIKTAAMLLMGLSSLYVLATGALGFDAGVTTGTLLGIMLYADMAISRTIKLTDAASDFYLVSLHSQRLTDVAVSPLEPDCETENALPLNGKIALRNLSYRHTPHEPYIFEGITLEIMPGESVAIVGASGCGKSTLLHVIAGLYEASEGGILINGVDTRNISKLALRNHIGFVMQDDTLLSGNIQKNITAFSDDVDINLMHECAELAAIHDDILAMPMGYETRIGDVGSALSGGQRQRISIARALYRKPSILLLDEATSDLDVANERKITQSISQLPITRVFVAHRPEMINSADRVYDLQKRIWVR